MIAQIENIIQIVSRMPINQQNDLAFFWKQDLESEIKFDTKISLTADKLLDLANFALKEFSEEKTINMGFDKL